MASITIGNRRIEETSDAFVIAEIGHNHAGDLTTALAMCRTAHECGCHAVKLQKRSVETCFTKAFLATPYNSEHAFGSTYGEHRRALEFGFDQYSRLKKYCDALGILMFATVFDQQSADFMERFDPPAYKIASADFMNIPLLIHVMQKRRPIIMSTLGASWDDMDRIYKMAKHYEHGIAFMHCTPYRTRPEDVNLRAIANMKQSYDLVIGFSSHFNGPLAAVHAYHYGARIIEQHFTLDRTAKGSDHAMSLEPSGMTELVRDLKTTKAMLGNGQKQKGNHPALAKMGKSIWPVKRIAAGTVLTENDIALKTPMVPNAYGPHEMDRVLDRICLTDLSTAAPIRRGDVK